MCERLDRKKQGAQRGDLPEGGETIEMWGSKYAWDSVLEDLQALSRHLLLNDSSKLDSHRLSSIRKTTLQVDVDVDCTETFFVSDDRTEEVGVLPLCVCVHAAELLLLPSVGLGCSVVIDPSSYFSGEPARGAGKFVRGACFVRFGPD